MKPPADEAVPPCARKELHDLPDLRFKTRCRICGWTVEALLGIRAP